MAECSPSVLILGHSFVRRMYEDLRNRFHPRANWNFDLSDATVSFHGVGGRTVKKLKKYDLEAVRRLNPDIIILEIGTNDLSLPHSDPSRIGSAIHDFVNLLLESFSVKIVGVCHVIPRCSYASHPQFWEKALLLQQYLSVVLDSPNVFCWKHSSFSNSSKPFYLPDGVHLNPVGQYLLYRSYRGAILKALRML